MSYPTQGNIAPALRQLSKISRISRRLNERGAAILDDIASALVGQQVIRYGRRYQIMQPPRIFGGRVGCYGVPVNKRGKVGVRGYDLGDLEDCEFVPALPEKLTTSK